MTITTMMTLFVAMALSAAIPGPSVLAVASRSVAYGWKQGFLVVFGVLLADYVFILLALTGLSVVSSLLGEFAILLKYIGAGYLFWLAYVTWLDNSNSEFGATNNSGSSILAGLLMTLSNPKAILFYMGFFPAFIDLTSIDLLDAVLIMAISTLSVGGVLCSYAVMASKAGRLLKGKQSKRWLNRLSGGILASCGTALIVKT
ncbi:LysE family translocator [Vibrio methylphosphonaticus]|uniref:LysE family translocator n=1 Tax=Vibrio methylphosphonaticus TaxID=2946866 RepID=UPI00202A872A|nr:LysE family translocator [Vibrio methylphosphonaticus]MCL9777173.1 LysE family translocator [Vibrio methylphosphonaticus]